MFMINVHIAYITCLVTNDAFHAYDVIGVYNIHQRAGEISYFAEQAILWLTGAVMGEVGAHNQLVVGNAPLAKRPRALVRKYIVLINQ